MSGFSSPYQNLAFLNNAGTVGELMKEKDWEQHPLGLPDNWPASLITSLSLVLLAKQPMLLFWDKPSFCFYNDAFLNCFIKSNDVGFIFGEHANISLPASLAFLLEPIENIQTGKENFISVKKITSEKTSEINNWEFNYNAVYAEVEKPTAVMLTCLPILEKENLQAKNIIANTAGTGATTKTAKTISEVEQRFKELNLFKFMTDNASEKLILIKKDAHFAYVNNRVLSKWGYTKKEIESLTFYDVDTLFKKEDFETLFANSFIDTSIQFETFHKNKSGVVFPVEVSSTGLELDGEPFIFVIARDITERKKADLELIKAFAKIEDSEKRFRESVKQAPFGIAIFKGENFISEMANSDYYKFINRTEQQFLNRPFFEAMPEFKEDVEPTFKEVLKTGKPYHSYEMPIYIKKPNGLVLSYFNLVYHPFKDETGKSTGIMLVAIEVTENVNAKLKLEESEKQFRNMIMQSPVAITILRGEDFVIETANKMMLKKIMGYEEKEVIGKPLLNVFPELKDQSYHTLLNSVFKRGKNLNIEEFLLVLQKNNKEEKMIVDISFTPMPATDKGDAAIMITASIVTEKVESRKSVEHSNERLRLATEAAKMGTFELDLVSQVLIHSPQLAIIFGENPDETFKYEILKNKIHEIDFEEIVRPAYLEAINSGYYFYEARIFKTPNVTNWIRTQGKVVFDEKGKPLKMMGTTIDITEAKLFTEKLEKSEERFRLLANEIPQLIWTADPQGNFIYFNEALYNFSGLKKDTLLKDGWIQIVHEEEREENLRLWKEAISYGADFLIEHRFRKYDGEYRWQLSRAIPQRDELGEIQVWVGSSTDIQEIKEQGQEKDFFISMASHELKTPVTSIKGYVQILQSLYGNTGEKFLTESLVVIDKQIVTLTKLITELLDISKIKSGVMEIKNNEFDIQELIKEVIEHIKHASPQYQINFKATAEPTTVLADKSRIEQVLINLLTNAIKYTPDIKIIDVICETNNNWVSISIKDKGIGISKTDQQKIFQRFYRVEGKNEQTYPGFGIGLFIASEILKKHKGTIRVKSELGKGSEFSFSLPLFK